MTETSSRLPVRTGVRAQDRTEMVLLLKPEDQTPVFHRWAHRDRRGRARPALLSNGLPVRWSSCGKFQLDVKTPAIRRDHAETIGRPCGVCFGGERRGGPLHVSEGLAAVMDRLEHRAAVTPGDAA